MFGMGAATFMTPRDRAVEVRDLQEARTREIEAVEESIRLPSATTDTPDGAVSPPPAPAPDIPPSPPTESIEKAPEN